MLKIWGRISSINVCKVVWAVRELGLEFERIDAGGTFGGLDTPEYLGLNPNSKIPTLDDDGFILWESNAIIRYLASRHGAGSFWPTDTRERAESDRWMDWQALEFNPALTPAFWNLVRLGPDKRNQQAVDESVAKTERLAVILDKVLEGRQYVAGSRFTMGDVPLGCAVDRWLSLPIERPATPALADWHRRICERPSAQGLLNQPLA